MNAVMRGSLLSQMLSGSDPARPLWDAVNNGTMAELAPEFLDLRMEQDPAHRHKDVLAHTITVVGQAPDDLIVRLAALFHDIAKPCTRKIINGEVTFRDHEAVGAGMARTRLTALGFDEQTVHDVSELVRLSGRFKGFDGGWSDSAVRRYVTDAGPLLSKLNQLVRADCTTRNPQKAARLQRLVDDLEQRIQEIAAADRRAAERPQIDGDTVMSHLGIGPGPLVGKALRWLLELKRSEGILPEDELVARLKQWAGMQEE